MPLYTEKPPVFEAKQFDGTIESATKIINWLSKNGWPDGSFTPEILNDDGSQSVPPTIRIQNQNGPGVYYRLRAGMWVMIKPNWTLDFFRDEAELLSRFTRVTA